LRPSTNLSIPKTSTSHRAKTTITNVAKMRFFNEKANASPTSSLDHANDRDYPHTNEYDDDLHVECPPHTTERKLVRKIDIHVIPCLCIMYREWRVFTQSSELSLMRG